MPSATDVLAADWLGLCRGAADALRDILAARPTVDERVEETGERGEGGDRTLVIDSQAEDAVFDRLEQLHRQDGLQFTAVSEERGIVAFGSDEVLVVIDPIDGSLNAKRGLPHHALSIAVADGPTMADVAFGFVHDFGPGEEWVARRGEGVLLNGEPLPPPPGERHDRDGRLELLAVESADPRWIARAAPELELATHRLRAMGSIAVSLCQVAAARVDGMATLWRSRAVDAAAAQLVVREAGGLVAFTAYDEPLAAPLATLDPISPVVAARTPQAIERLRRGAGLDARLVIDWKLARRIAKAVAGDADAALPGDLGALAADAEQRVVAYTGLVPSGPLPAPEAVDRRRWSEINLHGMRKVLDPVAERMAPDAGILTAPLRSAGGALLAAEVGGLTGVLSQRVLGQYELVLLDPDSPTRLLLVAPNLAQAARKLGVSEESLLAWVTFHEVTHAVQFTGVPWLRGHLAGMLEEMLATVEVKLDLGSAFKLPSRDDVEAMIAAVREDGLVALAVGPERKELLDRLQATMAVIEGHAEHVMDAVGRDALSDLDELRDAMDARRSEMKSGPWRVLEKLLGLELKMRQYEVGKRFCDAVVEAEGVGRLHEVFASPEALPTWAELQDPPAWLARTAA